MKKRKTRCKRCGQPMSDMCDLRLCAPTEMNPDAMKREIPGKKAIDEVPGQ